MAGLFVLCLTALAIGCSTGGTHSHGNGTVWVGGQLPNWDVSDMVENSDAVVIGTISRTLGEKQEQDSFDPPSFYYTFTDYELAVEQVLYSKADLPDRIAILIETGYAPIDDKMAIAGLDDIPAFEVNERILVFLYSLEDPEFSPGVARPVPDGFAASNYFQVLIAGQYAKLLPDGSNWKDSRHERTFTTPQLTNAIQNVGTKTR